MCRGNWGSRRPAAVRRRVAAAPLGLHWQCTPGAERLPCTAPQQRAWGAQLRGSQPLLVRAYFGERHVCMGHSVTCALSPGLGCCPLQLHNVGQLCMRPARSGAHHRQQQISHPILGVRLVPPPAVRSEPAAHMLAGASCPCISSILQVSNRSRRACVTIAVLPAEPPTCPPAPLAGVAAG